MASNVEIMRADEVADALRRIVDGVGDGLKAGDFVVMKTTGGVYLSIAAARVLSDEYIKLAEE